MTGAAVPVLDELAELDDGVPDEHAAAATVAAAAASASVAERYLFMAFLRSVQNSQVTTLNARPTGRAGFAASPAVTSPHTARLRQAIRLLRCPHRGPFR